MDEIFKRSVVREYSFWPKIALAWAAALGLLFYRPIAPDHSPGVAAFGTHWYHWVFLITGPWTLYIIISSYRGGLLEALGAPSWSMRVRGVALGFAVIVPWSLIALFQICSVSMAFGWFPVQDNDFTAHHIAARFVWANFFWPFLSTFSDLFPLDMGVSHHNDFSRALATFCRLTAIIAIGSVTLPALTSSRSST